jgi:hypothetical protein
MTFLDVTGSGKLVGTVINFAQTGPTLEGNPLIYVDDNASPQIAVTPHNVGAFLRRTFDYCVPNQRANIYINNQPAGTWYSAGTSDRVDVDGERRCWRDEEFPLPSTLTAGKASITLRIDAVRTTNPLNSSWTASRYQLYSFVLPQTHTIA